MEGAGEQSAPQTLLTGEISADLLEKRGKEGEKKENGEEKKEILKGRGKVTNEERTFFFPFFPLFKTTEICFGFTEIGTFYREKAFQARKKN